MAQPKRPSEVVAGQVRRWRRERGLSAADLAARISDLGGRMSRVTITKIEGRRHGVSLDDALILAAALRVPPAVLMFDLENREPVAIAPEVTIHPRLAARWLAGEELAASNGAVLGPMSEWMLPKAILRHHERLVERQEEVHSRESAVKAAEFVNDDARAREERIGFYRALKRLADERTAMRMAGIDPPRLPARWSKMMAEAGIKEGV
jgi:transcriptional regulator with XRE-family HTH domain